MQDFNFEAWFITIFIPFVSDLEKPVLLTFDGHNSHLTYNTVKVAMQKGIIIICLPPNTSHAIQPLDVGVFKSVKASWRNILNDWFKDSRLQTVDKAVFPLLLSKLWSCLKPQHAVNGFRGCGLLPVDRSAVQHRVLAESSGMEDNIEVLTPRKALRQAIINTVSPDENLQVPRKKRIRVQHKSGEILTEEEVLKRLEEEARTRQEKKQRKPANKSARKKRGKPASVDDLFLESLHVENEIMDERQDVAAEENDEEELFMSEEGEDILPNRAGSFHSESNNNCADLTMLEEGVSYVLALYEGSYFPGLVTKLKKTSVEISCMSKSGLFGWKWPAQPDIHAYPPQDIRAIINPPKAINKRNNFSVPDADHFWM